MVSNVGIGGVYNYLSEGTAVLVCFSSSSDSSGAYQRPRRFFVFFKKMILYLLGGTSVSFPEQVGKVVFPGGHSQI